MSTERFSCLALAMAFSALIWPVLATAAEPQAVLLWPNGAPGSEGKTTEEAVRLTPQGERIVSAVHHPSITPYLPRQDIATGAAVIVVPGGGHRELWMDHEGYRVAQWLGDHGIAAFVLKYRLAREDGSTYTVEGNALADVQRAIRLVRSRAVAWHIAPGKIGVIGFSAGGELAVLAGTRFDTGNMDAVDPIDRESAKPAFMGLLYPSLPSVLAVTGDTPATFLLYGADDSPAISEGSSTLYQKLRQAGVSAELHILAGVGHGFGIRASNPPNVANWTTLFHDWLGGRGLLSDK